MQDYVEKAKLIKQINDGMADIQKVEEEIAVLRMSLSNQSKRFWVSRFAVTNTSLIAFRQGLGRLSKAYRDLDDKVFEIMKAVDKIQP